MVVLFIKKDSTTLITMTMTSFQQGNDDSAVSSASEGQARKKAKVDVAGTTKKVESPIYAVVTAHQKESDELKVRHAKEEQDLMSRHKSELDAAKTMAKFNLIAAIKGAKGRCVSCDGILSEVLNSDELNCDECAIALCNECASDCEECKGRYCSSCRRKIGQCNGCNLGDQFTCGGCCQRMPCGELEHGDCVCYHHKHCRCERESC